MKEKKLVFIPLFAILIVSGCTQQSSGPDEDLTHAKSCLTLCSQALQNGADLSDGPCLSDGNEEWPSEDWVCDVAHSPRQDIDDWVENQCQAFKSGQASHFVEVDPQCNFIREI